MRQSATTFDETPVFIPADGNELFAILTRPTTTPNGVCVILLLGGVFSLSMTRNRLSVNLARKLASQGYHVFRMDFHGVGESSGPLDESRLDTPWAGDVLAGVEWLRAQGLSDFVLLGHCFGGRCCLAAVQHIPSVKGLGLISVPVMDYTHFELAVRNRSRLSATQFVRRATRKSVFRGIFNPRARKRYAHIIRAVFRRSGGRLRNVARKGSVGGSEQASPKYLNFLSGVIDRRIPTFIAFGTEHIGRDFDITKAGKLGKLLKKGSPFVEVHRFDRMAHGFPNLDSQDRSLELIEDWLTRITGTTTPAAELASAAE